MDLSPDEDNFQGRLLHQAALWDNVELLQELVASGADVEARDARQRTALHAAALADRSRCLRALCAAGADVNACADHAAGGETALHIAAERGHVENINVLLRAGARWDAPDAAGDTPLALAERAGRRHAANALREHRDAAERERLSQHAALRELVSRGDAPQLKARLAALGHSAPLVANMTPGGANTLLYVACEAGLTAGVAALLAAGADGRAHANTRYGPLHAACARGHQDAARLLLAHCPAAAQQETVEKWLPLHAACIGGHAALVTLLLEHAYPPDVLATYTDETGQWQYKAAFDVNALDVSGQSALYVACTLGNLAVVDALLSHTVPCERAPDADQHADTQAALPAGGAGRVLSPQRGISLGIHAIVSKLTGASAKQEPAEGGRRVRPVRVEGAAPPGDSCVARAVSANNARLLRRLLAAGAKADAAAPPPGQTRQRVGEARGVSGGGGGGGGGEGGGTEGAREARRRSRSASAAHAPTRSTSSDRSQPWSALALAARGQLVPLAELLLAAGATDPGGLALRECARHALPDLLAKLLATKAYPDPDYKLNKSSVSETVFSSREGDSALTYSALCPTTPVMVNWRELRCQLAAVRMSWLRAASLRVNKRLGSGGGALLAITRIDIANNELRTLPPELFTMVSLRYLNAAQNKLERLPSASDPPEDEPRRRRRAPPAYSAPVLQDLYLQDNRLEELPAELFALPSLGALDVANNKLRALPPRLWAAPALRDLNAALNLLRDLPAGESPGEPGSPVSAASSPHAGAEPADQFSYEDTSKNSSRSPSIERSESEPLDDDDAPVVVGNRAGNAVWSEARRAHAWRGEADAPDAPADGAAAGSRLASLNLSHNQFTRVPPALACRAPHLTRLNMAYNSLRSMSYVTSYPTSLRQLDLSHNEITCWPSLPQVESFGSSEGDPLACYCAGAAARGRPRSGGSVRAQLLSAACAARRHLRLEGLRTLILSNNLLTRIQLTTDDDGLAAADSRQQQPADDDWGCGSSLRGRLLFPLLSMLDVSCNLLRAVPPAIHELSNLSVLNISGNKDITELPPQMGLLSRLWNLNAAGCALAEPLRSLVRGRCRSADVVGYLKSVLQEARPYAHMKLMLVGLQGIGKTSLLECLRQESALQHRRKPTDHWAKRMGNKSSRRNMSTVGVDIGTWVYEKHRSARGPVTFRTWDFGGQQEYYATHQYFLSRRSLYLVLWRAIDGREGLAGALDWLRSIQARAPGSPVIMVATHYDQVANYNLPESESPEALQRLIRCSIMGAPDADKRGLPRVLDSLEVSCSTRHNIRLLADIIYSVAFSVKPPGSKEPLLEQLVPASYLALEECVTALAQELREPVLRQRDYRRLVTQYMQARNLRMFRDAAELHQATMFLHENGVLLHYDDATLKELYFLRPQWLCDVLAHVVTVREINPFCTNGIMRTEDLAHVFKASPLLGGGEEAAGLGASLLNKFELALGWDSRTLLVPPLLPAAEPPAPQLVLRRGAGGTRGTPRRAWPSLQPQLTPAPPDSTAVQPEAGGGVVVSARGGPLPLRRLLLVSYVPRGFWPRLVARVLADSALAHAAQRLYPLPPELEVDESVTKALQLEWGWRLWRTGMRLACGALTLLALAELPPRRDELLPPAPPAAAADHPCHAARFRVRAEGAWCTLDPAQWASVELLLPAHTAVLRRADDTPIGGCQSISLEPNPETLAKVLALVSDHVDLLLEDWYPSLGTRFVHTSEGRCLITRLVPCPLCLREAEQRQEPEPDPAPGAEPEPHAQLAQAFRRLELGNAEPRRLRLSQESRDDDGDSGVGPESNASSRVGSVEGIVNGAPGAGAGAWEACAWAVEECILAACTQQPLACAHHGQLQLRDVAPDTLLLDVEEEKRARWEHISRGALAGRGAFGTVLAAAWRRPGAPPLPVALKALQPVPPPPASDILQHHAYKAALSRWERDPVSAACRAYCGLRQELCVLSLLTHPHVVPLAAVCAQPLALLLDLAPQGALDGVLRQYAGCGCRVGERAARALTLQLAKALEYLHSSRVLYRDLKSENVLVWSMPLPQEAAAAELSHAPVPVHVKLGDYGISRLAPPSGTKGFGGTEGFMAPEIMRYNGEEEYNEKVDCFSFGMLLYEVMSLRQPFEGHEAVKEAVLEGARPTLTTRELQYPCNMLDTMRRCWSGAPELRPSAAALVSVLAAPEYTALCDAAAARPATAAAAVPLLHAPPPPRGDAPALAAGDECDGGWEIWYGGEPDRAHSLVATRSRFAHHHTLRVPPDNTTSVQVTAACRVGSKVWLGDSEGRVSVYNGSSCALVWSARVQEAVGGAASPVAALLPLVRLQRVALALRCGRLFLVRSSRPEGESTFVVSELGAATELCCLAAVPTPHGVEVWAGGDGLNAYAVSAAGVCGADAVPTGARVALLAAHSHRPVVIAYTQPGTHVYQYSAVTRQQTARLDCSKLAPCSESLHSLPLDAAAPDAQHAAVTALCVAGGCVYAGTAGGCVVVADAASLRPLTVFRPYEGPVSCIVPLVSHEGAPGPPMLATFGDGYRPLLNRFQANHNQQNNSSPVHSGVYCLLWRAHHWLPD